MTTTIPATLTYKLYLPMLAMNILDAVNGVNTTYYSFNGARVAMRTGSNVYWLHGDHLGSASLTTGIAGAVVSEMRYTPFGEVHWSNGNTPTDRTFTGQRVENAGSVGSLMNYGARFYSPILGRFISADSIIPQPGNPQSLNRYSYTLNNPLKYIDPTGHYSCIWAACSVLPTPTTIPPPTTSPPPVVVVPAMVLVIPTTGSALANSASVGTLSAIGPALPYVAGGSVIVISFAAMFVGVYAYARENWDQPDIPYPPALGSYSGLVVQPTYPLRGTGTATLNLQPYAESRGNRNPHRNPPPSPRETKDKPRVTEPLKQGSSPDPSQIPPSYDPDNLPPPDRNSSKSYWTICVIVKILQIISNQQDMSP